MKKNRATYAHEAVAILGGGRLGQVIAQNLGRSQVRVNLWTRNADHRSALAKAGHAGVMVVPTIEQACNDVQTVFLAVPMHGLREVASEYGRFALGDHVVVHATRGVLPDFVLPHQVIRSVTCVRKIAALGGPLYAPDLVSARPVAGVVATRFDEAYEAVSRLCRGTTFVAHRSADIVGVEIAGAMSNVTALATGMSDALEFGETARGMLMARGLQEAAMLGVLLGAERKTFAGLAGVGDLIPRHVESTRRHVELGAALARGASIDPEALATLDGPTTAKCARWLAHSRGVTLHLAAAVHAIIEGTAAPMEALEAVLGQDLDLDAELWPRIAS